MIRSTIRTLVLGAAAASALSTAMPALAAGPVCKAEEGYAADFDGRRTFRWKPQWLKAVKADLADPSVAPAYRALLARAEKALDGPSYAVTEKTRVPPSGDKHDYISMGPYWWPDPAQPTGEPYIRRDGEVNPERNTNAFDAVRMDSMASAVEVLSLAYYFTDDAKYATKAAQLLRVVESIGLLAPSKALAPAEQKGLEAWFGDYVAWLGTGPTAKEERAAQNNHGIWYDYQLATFSLFARRPDLARTVIAEAGKTRVDPQIDPDGKMPKELARTRGLHYSYFALEPLVGMAELGPCVGVDLWGYKGPRGQGIRAAFDYLAPYVGDEAAFPFKELKPQDATEEALPLYDLAAAAYGYASFAAKADFIAKKDPAA